MDLPIEVLIYLFKYLPHGDRVAASQACRLWHEAACDKAFQNKQHICFTKNVHQNEQYITNVFSSRSYQKFTSYTFREIDLENRLSEFWKQNGPYIKSLDFDECEMHEKMFIKILNSTKNLESLSVSNCRELFMSASLIDDDLKNLCSDSLKNLKKLNLSNNRYLTDALFSRFVSSTQSLEELNLSDCPITFHKGLHAKFYPTISELVDTNKPSESILTFFYVFRFLTHNGSTLKNLYFNKTLIDGSALETISELPNLNLTSFQAYGCDQLNIGGIISLSQNQTNLTELNLGRCSRVTDDVLKNICKNLINLKSLNISECLMVTSMGAIDLINLKQLQQLDISTCSIASDGISKGICSSVNTKLLELNVSSLDLDEHITILISNTLPNLKHLNMNFCFSSVTDRSIQEVFKNLIHLNVLHIKFCENVSDAGLTGMGMGEHTDDAESSISSKSAMYQEKFHRISLRSRAEEEIVRDANRKRNVRELCQKYNGETVDGYSLARLKSLQSLDVSGCNRITDVSLIYAFNSKELKSLYLNDCQQISREGLDHLSKNCPSLERLELINCNNMTDDGVGEIVQNLHRLKYLYLKDCNRLTDASIYSILDKCKSLKVLDIRCCRNISADVANLLYHLPTLHTLHMSKPGPYISDDKNKIKPPQPPPQPKFKLLRRIF